MNFVVLYGPPAVGKLTIARELAAITGYRLFHNHLTIAPVNALFEFGAESFIRLVSGFRRQLIAEAAYQDLHLIYTFVLTTERGQQSLEELCRIVEGYAGKVCLTNITCEPEPSNRA